VLNGLKGWFNRDDCCDGCRGGGVGMSGRWLQEGFEGRIVDGNWQQILGLLEDCFRCSDGMVGKKEVMIGPEVPYFGKYVGVFGRGAEGKWEGEEKKEEKKEHMYHVKVPVDPFFSDLSPQKHHGGKKPVNFISSNFPFEEDEPTEVSERSERALWKTRAMKCSKLLQTATSTTKLTPSICLAGSFRSRIN